MASTNAAVRDPTPAPGSSRRILRRRVLNIEAIRRATGAGVKNCPFSPRRPSSRCRAASRRRRSTLSTKAPDGFRRLDATAPRCRLPKALISVSYTASPGRRPRPQSPRVATITEECDIGQFSGFCVRQISVPVAGSSATMSAAPPGAMISRPWSRSGHWPLYQGGIFAW